MEEQTKTTNWLQEEAENLKNTVYNGDSLPALKLQENMIAEIEVDFSNKFEEWTSEDGNLKKIIPVTFKGEKLVWWLNVKNPIYHSIVTKGRLGITKFKVLQTGTQKNTRYILVDEDQSELPREVASIQG